MVNDVRRIAHDLEELYSHDYGISGGSALHAGLTLPSVAELGDTEETSSHEWTSRLRGIRICVAAMLFFETMSVELHGRSHPAPKLYEGDPLSGLWALWVSG